MRFAPARWALTAVVVLASAAPAAACINVGVYQDNPPATLPGLIKHVGPGITEISTYMTAGQPLQSSLITFANQEHAGLMVTWQPDGGRNGALQPSYRLKAIANGKYDQSLKALVAQLRQVHAGVIFRPMPEMNTPWYPWSGTVNGNTPREYVAAWKRVRKAIRSAPGGSRLKLLWAPYARSIPATTANELQAYFPGASQVDLVGASAYNFGATGGLTWSEPGDLFGSAYATIEALANKPFWMAETGSTSVGGDEAGWILTLGTLQSTALPKLAGVIWYDINDPTGNFLLQGKPVLQAFKSLLEEACQ